MKKGISIVIPAYNEEHYILSTLNSIEEAIKYSSKYYDYEYEVIVVDNKSTDNTIEVLKNKEVSILSEPIKSIGKVRNTGAFSSSHELLVFIDADILVPLGLFTEIIKTMGNSDIIGGSVDIKYKPKSKIINIYLKTYRAVGSLFNLSQGQGATQFVKKDIFVAVEGYPEKYLIGEDVEFFWKLIKYANLNYKKTCHLTTEPVTASTRRFDNWSLFKVVFFTNPLIILLTRKFLSFWGGWYANPPR